MPFVNVFFGSLFFFVENVNFAKETDHVAQ